MPLPSRAALPLALVALLLTGGIFGFFYAWVCSTMWGLDRMEPAAAIAAMQAMNGSVRNAVFFPAFFLTPLALVLAGLASLRIARPAGRAFLLAALVYLAGGLVLTLAVNVPMNETLALVDPAVDSAAVWADYSPRWQFWNLMRTIASGVALVLAGWGTWRLGVGGRADLRR